MKPGKKSNKIWRYNGTIMQTAQYNLKYTAIFNWTIRCQKSLGIGEVAFDRGHRRYSATTTHLT